MSLDLAMKINLLNGEITELGKFVKPELLICKNLAK